MMKLWFNKKLGFWQGFIHLFSPRYSHVEVQFSDGMSFSAIEGKGARFLQIDYSAKQWDSLDVPADEEQEATMRAFAQFIEGSKYDWPGILNFPFKFVKQDPTKWFCSEACTAVMRMGGFLQKLVPHKTSPRRLYNAWRKELKALRKAQLQPTGTLHADTEYE